MLEGHTLGHSSETPTDMNSLFSPPQLPPPFGVLGIGLATDRRRIGYGRYPYLEMPNIYSSSMSQSNSILEHTEASL
jgi:hypothetical protein